MYKIKTRTSFTIYQKFNFQTGSRHLQKEEAGLLTTEKQQSKSSQYDSDYTLPSEKDGRCQLAHWHYCQLSSGFFPSPD